jgi:ankyrin repeat protein
MKRINGQTLGFKDLANKVLSWITCAKRQITTTELQQALAVEVSEPELDKENFYEIQDMVSVCAGLVTVDKESDIIRLVHFTTQEYFERTQKDWFPTAETDITKTCVTYLSFSVFDSGICATNKEFEERLQSNRLYDYAARNWGYHACAASTVIEQWTEVEQLIQDFLENETNISAASQAMMASRSSFSYSQSVPRQMTGVHIAAYFGLVKTIKGLLKNAYSPDLQDSYGRTALSLAAEGGHEDVVKLLLETGKVDVGSEDEYDQTPLWWAAMEGHEVVVKLLVDTGKVDVESKGRNGQMLLRWAAVEGHEAVIKLLVDVESKGKNGRILLSWAAMEGHEAVVKLLLETGKVDVESKDKDGHTPLWLAARGGHEAVVKLLLETGKVDVESKDEYYGQTPLWWAARQGHDAVVKLLLETGKVDVEPKDKYGGQTPLSRAAWGGHEAVVKLLLETGKVDVESKDKYGQTPLSRAAWGGHDAVVNLLRPRI